jgi:hypothetical protein
VGLDGAPLADVRCRLSMNEYEIDGGPWMNSGQEVTTDWLGRFSFTDVPPAEIFVRCSGYGSSTELALPPDEPCRDLRIELVRSGTFVFESSNPHGGPRTLHVLDEADERLSLEVWLGKGRSISPRELAVQPGGTCRATVSELARWLVLLDGERELTRRPLVIRHGEETRVRW